MISPRPESLAVVAQRATDPRTFRYELTDFLHEFQQRRTLSMLAEQPQRMANRFEMAAVYDVFLAAVAEHLAHEIGCEAPAWAGQETRVLSSPWFAAKSGDLRAVLLVESPAAFRARNLFVSANALSVA